MGQKMLVMSEGRIVQQGEPQTLYTMPQDLITAKSMHSFNIFSGDMMADYLKAGIKGKVPATKISRASHCAVRMDKISVANSSAKASGLEATFLTSEFLGNKVIYFFKTNDNRICEVEDHMSLSEPKLLNANNTYRLSWDASDMLLYDENKQLIS